MDTKLDIDEGFKLYKQPFGSRDKLSGNLKGSRLVKIAHSLYLFGQDGEASRTASFQAGEVESSLENIIVCLRQAF